MEGMTGIEPASPVWKTGVLTTVRHPHIYFIADSPLLVNYDTLLQPKRFPRGFDCLTCLTITHVSSARKYPAKKLKPQLKSSFPLFFALRAHVIIADIVGM